MSTVTHRTVYRYNKAGTKCTVEHSTKGRHESDEARWSSNDHHQKLVDQAKPKRPGQWVLITAGGSAGTQDHRGYISTYYAKWRKVA